MWSGAQSIQVLSQFFKMFENSKLLECMFQKPLITTTCTCGDFGQTGKGGNKRIRCIRHLQKILTKACRENKVQLWQLSSCVIRRFLCLKVSSRKFVHIFADVQVTFCLVLDFLSRVATIRMYFSNLECRNTTLWMFNRDLNIWMFKCSNVETSKWE